MALVHNRTMTTHDHTEPGPDPGERPQKRVYLLAAFPATGDQGPAEGLAEHVIAVIAMECDQQRFEWVGEDQGDSVANPALVTPIRVRLGLPSPWHDTDDDMVTGLVQLAPEQLGDGTVDEDLDHLLTELARSRGTGPTSHHPEAG